MKALITNERLMSEIKHLRDIIDCGCNAIDAVQQRMRHEMSQSI